MSASQFQSGPGGPGGRRGRRGGGGGGAGSQGPRGPRDPYQSQGPGGGESPEAQNDIAIRMLQRALAESQERGDKAGMLTSHISLAVALLEASHPQEALEHNQRALELAEEINDSVALATAHLRMGQIQSDLKNHAEAI